MGAGKFVVSLDFELMWGVRDSRTIESYGQNIIGVHTAIPRLLKMFTDFSINGTFSTVGFLFFENKETLLKNLPAETPKYKNKNLSPYEGYFKDLGDLEKDKYHFAPQLIKLIQECPGQEIGTHTFSHYYCLEEGQDAGTFREDIIKAVEVANKYGIILQSLVFPRNQFNNEYLKVCSDHGILCYRGNEQSWIYNARKGTEETRFRKAIRLVDSYFNISGHNCYTDAYMVEGGSPVNIPASRFLRPFSKTLRVLDTLRLSRIKSGMTHAAKNSLTYHLWWHPHNFGINMEENFAFLEKILVHYKILNEKFNFQSYTMSKLTGLLTQSV